MSSATIAKRSFAVAFAATFVASSALAAGQAVLADSEAEISAGVLRQVESSNTSEEDGEPVPDVGEEVDGNDIDVVLESLEADGLTETLDVYLSRDPFAAVVPAVAEGGGDGGSGDGSQPGDPVVDPVDDDGSGGGGGTGVSSVCRGSTDETVCDGTVVTLVSVGDSSAVVQVDTARYEVTEGEVFAESFRVAAIESPCVRLQYGDEIFSLCEGASVLK